MGSGMLLAATLGEADDMEGVSDMVGLELGSGTNWHKSSSDGYRKDLESTRSAR